MPPKKNMQRLVQLIRIITAIVSLFSMLYILPSNAQDTGSLKFQITRNSDNKQDISGFVCIPRITDTRLHSRYTRHPYNQNFLQGIIQDFKKNTSIQIMVDDAIPLYSSQLSRYPLLYFVPSGLTESEKINIRDYINGGGFVVFR